MLVFAVAAAAFAVARAAGWDESWHDGLLGALVIAGIITVLDVIANRHGRLPTSR